MSYNDPKDRIYPTRKDGNIREGSGTSKVPQGKSLKELESVPNEPGSPAQKMLTHMLTNPEPSYDPTDPNSLFWAVGRKFTAEMKIKFLQMTAKYGRVGLAAHSVGISPSTILNHREKDKRFDQLVRDAESFYRESTAAVIMRQARDGLVERKWNGQGQLISERRTYETQLRIKLLDWCDPSFNVSQKQEITVKGGAVMVPGPVDSVNDWDSVLAALNQVEAAQTKPMALPASETASTAFPVDSLAAHTCASETPPGDDYDSLEAISNGSLIYDLPDSSDPDSTGQ